jgi:glyoxylase-like metal-dependent hydrolase (beta-lactamase superfamily II)
MAAMLAASPVAMAQRKAQPPNSLRLYVFDCGRLDIPDVTPYQLKKEDMATTVMSVPCFLVAHPKGKLMWDVGAVPDSTIPPGGTGRLRVYGTSTKTLRSQLAGIGYVPGDITYLALSHFHWDHVGNANLFTQGTLYMQQAEYDAAFGPEPAKYGFNPAVYDKLRNNPVVKLNGDHDVFGDSTVTIISTPGHTPGHQSLLLRLPKAGTVVLSGDLAHFRENFDQRRVPGFNFNKDQSLASMDRVGSLLLSEHAQLWINHDSAQNATIPHAPQYVE